MTMNSFDELRERVVILNEQLKPLYSSVGSESRQLLQNQLWEIVGLLNRQLSLGLANTALDLSADDEQLIIHYYSGIQRIESETRLYIDNAYSVRRVTDPLKPLTLRPAAHREQQPPPGK